jgi:hypothetical protein
LFPGKETTEPSNFFEQKFPRIIKPRQISPFVLYLSLKPLYSTLGGETTLAEPFKKKPIGDDFLLKPLYKWNTCNHLTVVLSEALTQVCREIIKKVDF